MRILLAFILFALALPAAADDRAAIGAAVQQQLQRCWNLPAGYEGRKISIELEFLGDGTLLGAPEISLDSTKAAAKLQPLADSVIRAADRCAPFSGVDALGAAPDERFTIIVHFQS